MRMLAVAAALLVAGCSLEDGGAGAPVVRFIAMGDSGAPAPDGESENVAAVIEQVCALRGCDFALGAGDNIYEMGAAAPEDPLFQAAFELPYANLDFPFFMALGNHDNALTPVGEGGANFKGDAQVAYHDSALGSGKWRMPARYYRQAWPEGAAEPVVELFVLDSSPITHFYDDPSPLWSGGAVETYIAEQQVFLQDALAGSRATWKMALAHHPYISNGDHGNAGEFDLHAPQDPCTIAGPLASASCRGAAYKAFIESTVCDRADVFFTGHDHNLFWLEPAPACGRTHHILSGAASKERANNDEGRNPAFFQAGSTFGFFWVELQGRRMTAAAYTIEAGGTPTRVDGDGNPLPVFEKSVTK